jgi:hypothetical protein
MNLKFACTKTQFIDAMKKELGVYGLLIESDGDVKSVIETWLANDGVSSGLRFIEPAECKVDGERVIVGIRPTWELEMFGDAGEIREPDRRWILNVFNRLQKTILAPEETD